jgi:ribonuclease E
MFINAIDDEECRIAVLDGRELQELYLERSSTEHHVGNIYKGRVTNVEPSIQAAFVDYGQPKNGFLHVSDIIPSYLPESLRSHGPMRPPIQQILKRGQEVIAQVTKEGIGTKGPTMTTYLSIAGRYLVLMPGLNRVGVSRKIEDEEERRKLREALEGLERPKNLGVIIRTAGLDQPKRELQRDLNYLQRVWKMLLEHIKISKCPSEIYRESDLVARTIRDIFTPDVATIHVDDPEVAQRARDFLQMAMPRYANRIALYEDKIPLFHRYGLEEQIEKVYSRTVPLPCGGYLVIDQAEALVAIDVNSGKFRTERNAEESAFKLNMEAAAEIVRQLRLRDLGGVIVMDFVDMRSEKHQRAVEDLLRKEMKKDRARSKILKTSKFGLIEMTRQRMRASIERSAFMECPHCRGSGLIKTSESMALDVMRQITLAMSQDHIMQVEVTVHPAVAHYIHNRKRRALVRLEERTGRRIMVIADPNVGQEMVAFQCLDNRAIPVKFDPREAARQQQLKLPIPKEIPLPPPLEDEEEDESLAEVEERESDEAQERESNEPEEPESLEAELLDKFDEPVASSGGSSAAGEPAVTGLPGGPPDRQRSRRRHGRRGGRGHRKPGQVQQTPGGEAPGGKVQSREVKTSVSDLVAGQVTPPAGPAAPPETPKKPVVVSESKPPVPETAGGPQQEQKPKPRRRRSHRGGRGKGRKSPGSAAGGPATGGESPQNGGHEPPPTEDFSDEA